MESPLLEVADIFRRNAAHYLCEHGSRVNRDQRRAIGAIEACRTAALGGHVEECTDCGHTQIAYNSCRNRHCPKCQGSAARRWLEARRAELLDVPYFHVVFTLPTAIAEIAYFNKAVVYGLLMRTVADTLKIIAADAKHLGAEIGGIGVLHTWGQTLTHHPHVHCIIPGGGLTRTESNDNNDEQWISCRPNFFLPVRVLARLFRRLFLQRLAKAHSKLVFPGKLRELGSKTALTAYLTPLARANWVVYAKPPFGGPDQVLAYLSRYTHRVAISNSRLISANEASVTFRYKDYRQNGRKRFKTMTLPANEFIRRFLQHVLPKGFRRIRHFGFLANSHRTAKITRIRTLIRQVTDHRKPDPDNESNADTDNHHRDKPMSCPCCGGVMRLVFEWKTMPRRAGWPDTS